MPYAMFIVNLAFLSFVIFRVTSIMHCINVAGLHFIVSGDFANNYDLVNNHLIHDFLLPALADYSFDISPYIPHLTVVYAEEHESLISIRNDSSSGGVLLNTLINNAISSNTTGLDVSLTPVGISESEKLINFYNALPSSSIVGTFIESVADSPYTFHTTGKVTSENWLLNYHTMPVYSKDIVYCGSNSGVYMFTHQNNQDLGIGSALTMKSRSMEHYISMTSKPKHFMHHWIMSNGGANSIKWSPVMTGMNFNTQFQLLNPMYALSKGESNLLMSCSVYVPRIFEQMLQTHFQPSLNGKGSNGILNPVIFFNHSLQPVEYDTITSGPIYELYDVNGTFAQAKSITKLQVLTGRSRDTLTRYMNYIPLEYSSQFVDNMLTIPEMDNRSCYLRRVGAALHHNLPSVTVHTEVLQLANLSLDSLPIDQLFVYEPDKDSVYASFNSRRELFLHMYSSKSKLLLDANYTLSREILRNYVTAHLNIENLHRTDHGYFYFACNPAFGKQTGQGLFVIDLNSGNGNYYSSITSCANDPNTAPNKGIRNYINGVTTPSQKYSHQAYIPAEMLIDAIPGIVPKVDVNYDFTSNLEVIKGLKLAVRQNAIDNTPGYQGRVPSVGIVVVDVLTGIATFYASLHSVSTATTIGRQSINRYITGQYKPVKFPNLMFMTSEVFTSLIYDVLFTKDKETATLSNTQIGKVENHIIQLRKDYKVKS